jgi:predicted alpha/beta-fold hydrolase
MMTRFLPENPAMDFSFRPLPLLSNPHVQTLLGYWLPGPRCPAPQRQHVVWLPDGDGLVLHDNIPPGWQPGEAMALLVHGLTGSHASGHIKRLAALLLPRGVRVVRMDQRGTGKGLALARGSYHAGRSADIRAALEAMHNWSPVSPLLLIGVSLGGNLVLKMAAEAADDPVPGLVRVAALAPPVDLEACARLLELPRNRIYEIRFVRDLLREAHRRQRIFPDQPAISLPTPLTIRKFDDLYTAPRAGFADAHEYYRRSSSAPLIPHISVPTLILTARDDPFIAVEPFDELKVPAHITVRVVSHGGHMGFLGWDGAGGIRWGNRRVVEWILHRDEKG